MSGAETFSKEEPVSFEQGLHQANNAIQQLRDAIRRVNVCIANAHMAGVSVDVRWSVAGTYHETHISSLPKMDLDDAFYIKRIKI